MYIEVAPDKQKTFIVQTAGFAVKVFGTKFNVSSYEGSSSSVVLVEGSISLSATGKELILSPNEQAVLSDMGILIKNGGCTTVYQLERWLSNL